MTNLIETLSCNYTAIIPTKTILENNIHWGGNGVGDRWMNKKYNYAVIYGNKKTRTYSENEDDIIPETTLQPFLQANKGTGIIGIYVFSQRKNIITRPIRKDIHSIITKQPCVVCGSKSDIVCDHKNDLYNDPRVLKIETQTIDDFQPLCNHCNLQKRQVQKEERANQKLYSAKNIQRYAIYPFVFPWEKHHYDETNKHCKEPSFWYDPIEFHRKLYIHTLSQPFLQTIKRKPIV